MERELREESIETGDAPACARDCFSHRPPLCFIITIGLLSAKQLKKRLSIPYCPPIRLPCLKVLTTPSVDLTKQ